MFKTGWKIEHMIMQCSIIMELLKIYNRMLYTITYVQLSEHCGQLNPHARLLLPYPDYDVWKIGFKAKHNSIPWQVSL